MSAVKKMVRGAERISFWRVVSGMARRAVRGWVLRYSLYFTQRTCRPGIGFACSLPLVVVCAEGTIVIPLSGQCL